MTNHQPAQLVCTAFAEVDVSECARFLNFGQSTIRIPFWNYYQEHVALRFNLSWHRKSPMCRWLVYVFFSPTCQVSCFVLPPSSSPADSDLNCERRSQWALPDLNRERQMSDRMPQRMPDRMSDTSGRMPYRISEDIYIYMCVCQKECQTECQNICQIEC